MSDRSEAIANAVRFLSDEKVKEAPLAKKIAFLEGKGLSSSEIQTALNQVENGSSSTTTISPPQQSLQMQQHQPFAPPPSFNWRQAVITSVGFFSAGAALMYAAKIYLDPYFDLPTGKSVRKDTETMEKGIKETCNALDQVSLSTHDLIKGLEAHAANVSTSLSEMSSLLNNLRESDDKKSVEITLIKNEVEELKSTFPKLVEKTQENQSNMLNQIQSEIKSLKSLLLNRRPMDSTSPLTALTSSFSPSNTAAAATATHHQTSTTASSSSVLAGVHFGKPSIPAWQISAKKEKEKEEEEKAPSQSIDDVDGGGAGDVSMVADGQATPLEREKKGEKRGTDEQKRNRSQSPARRKGAKSPTK